jgi:carboxypeptidase Taq
MQLSRAQAVLAYNQQVFMPPSASRERGAQLAALATVIHDQQTHASLLALMDEALRTTEELVHANNDDVRRLLELERKAFLENQRVPVALAAKAASFSSSAYSDWVKAKQANAFHGTFCATLQASFDTAMQLAAAKQDSTKNLYNQMLDEFEVGMPQE